MSAEKTKKTNKGGLTPMRHEGWLSPFGRIDEMFEDFFRRPFGRPMWSAMPRIVEELETSPSVDIFEEGDNIIMKCEMPGMTKDDIELNLTENMITISGEKKKEKKIKIE